MRLFPFDSKQVPLFAMLLAAAVVFVAFSSRYLQATAAERAINQKSAARLAAVLDRHPELRDKPNRKTGLAPLHLAVMSDQTNLVKLLLDRGAAVQAADRYGLTPLHKAAAFNRLALAEMLLDKGAEPRAFGLKYGLIRVAPIHLAAEAGFGAMVQLFLDRGVDINLRTQGTNQVTCLHMAAARGQAEVVELLLKAGAEVNARDAYNQTPLAWARRAGQEEIISMLKIYDGVE